MNTKKEELPPEYQDHGGDYANGEEFLKKH